VAYVVAHEFAFHIMTFVSDHMALGRSEAPLENALLTEPDYTLKTSYKH
jgi:hypothetical protein